MLKTLVIPLMPKNIAIKSKQSSFGQQSGSTEFVAAADANEMNDEFKKKIRNTLVNGCF